VTFAVVKTTKMLSIAVLDIFSKPEEKEEIFGGLEFKSRQHYYIEEKITLIGVVLDSYKNSHRYQIEWNTQENTRIFIYVTQNNWK